jgi:hypothetical protein
VSKRIFIVFAVVLLNSTAVAQPAQPPGAPADQPLEKPASKPADAPDEDAVPAGRDDTFEPFESSTGISTDNAVSFPTDI